MQLPETRLNRFREILTRIHPCLNGSFLEYLVVIAAFMLLTVIYTDFVLLDMTHRVFTRGPGDGTGGFMWYSFVQPGLHIFLEPSNVVNYPYGENIGGPGFITYLGFWIPVRVLSLIFGPIGGLNMFMVLGFTLTATSMYWLVKRLTSSLPVSYFSGFAAAFVPYSLYKSVNHLPYILSYVFVFVLAGFIALWLRPTLLRATLLGLAVALAFYTDGYYILIAPVLLFCLFIAGLLYSVICRTDLRSIGKKITYLIIAGLIALIAIAPIAYMQISNGSQIKQSLEDRRSNFAGELETYRAHPIDFLIPADTNPLLSDNADFQRMHNFKNHRSNPDESTNYIGYTLILLSLVGVGLLIVYIFFNRWSSMRGIEAQSIKKIILAGSILTVSVPVMLSFMLSPSINIRGFNILLPGQFLIDANITLWRVMSRFFVAFHIVIVFFSAISLWLFLKTQVPNNQSSRVKKYTSLTIVLLLGILLAIEYSATPNRPTYDFNNVSEGYYWLRKQENIKVIAELDIVDPIDSRTARYVTNQIVHAKKLINFKEDTSSRLTNTLGGPRNKETIDWVIDRGAQAIITHDNRACNDTEWGVVIHSSEDSYMDADDDTSTNIMCIYRPLSVPNRDDQFVEFVKGFVTRPNIDDQSGVVIGSSESTLVITDNDYRTFSKEGRTHFFSFLNVLSPESKNGTWSVFQEGHEVAGGTASQGINEISIILDRTKPVTLRLKNADGSMVKSGDYALTQTEVYPVR